MGVRIAELRPVPQYRQAMVGSAPQMSKGYSDFQMSTLSCKRMKVGYDLFDISKHKYLCDSDDNLWKRISITYGISVFEISSAM